jgi:hypothetical protein
MQPAEFDTHAGFVLALQGLVQAALDLLRPLYEGASAIDPAATYTVTDLDATEKVVRRSGTDLMTDGLLVNLPQQPQAALITVAQETDAPGLSRH